MESLHGWDWKPSSFGVLVYEGDSMVLGCNMQNFEIGKWSEASFYEGGIHWELRGSSTLSRGWFCWFFQQPSPPAQIWHPWSHVHSTLSEKQSETCKFIVTFFILLIWLRLFYLILSNEDVHMQGDPGFLIPCLEEVVITMRSPLNAE